MKHLIQTFSALVLWGFVAGKIVGATAFVDWSWWWVLLPIVPWLGTAIRLGGL